MRVKGPSNCSPSPPINKNNSSPKVAPSSRPHRKIASCSVKSAELIKWCNRRSRESWVECINRNLSKEERSKSKSSTRKRTTRAIKSHKLSRMPCAQGKTKISPSTTTLNARKPWKRTKVLKLCARCTILLVFLMTISQRWWVEEARWNIEAAWRTVWNVATIRRTGPTWLRYRSLSTHLLTNMVESTFSTARIMPWPAST